MSKAWHRLAAAIGLILTIVFSATSQEYGRVELLRDNWGIPHVFSDTDRGAMYGLGYATAQERGFQMTYGWRSRPSPIRSGSRCTTWTRRKRFARWATAIGRTAATAPARRTSGWGQSSTPRR